MKSVTVILAFLFSSIIAAQSPPPTQKEKVAEGEYVRMKEGQAIQGSSQSWTLWRVPGGYQLEDHFLLTNPAADLLQAVGPRSLSPGLRQKLQSEVRLTALEMELDSTLSPSSLTVTGTKVMDSKPVEVLRCETQHQSLRCKGLKGEAKISNQDARQLFYSFPFPMMFMHLVATANSQTGSSSTVPLIDINSDQPTDPARGEATVKNLGPSAIQLGDQNFSVTEYQIRVHSEAGRTVEATLWSSPNRLLKNYS